MTLATICTNAILELSGIELPGSFAGNDNLTARTCVALVQAAGDTLIRQYRWTALLDTHTFQTVSGTSAYAMPDDFHAFAPMTPWDQTNERRLQGPTQPAVWAWLTNDIAAGSTIDRWFRRRGAYFDIHPTPTSADTIYYEYYSNAWITRQLDGQNVGAWASDNDIARLDETLLKLALKWRLLQSKGMPYEPEYKEYEAFLEELLADEGGKGRINLGRPTLVIDGIPDNGYGQ